jgi:hypothetical protein
MALVPLRRDPEFALKKMEMLYLLFKMIISHGLDPGQIWSYRDSNSCGSPLPFLALFSPMFAPLEFLSMILNTVSTIIEYSVQDPLSTADFTRHFAFYNVPQSAHPPQSYNSSCTKNTGSPNGKLRTS